MAKKTTATAGAAATATEEKPATFEDVLAHNAELAAQVGTLTALVEDLKRAALRGVGIDSALGELVRSRERAHVQFLENYSRAPLMSTIQKNMALVEGYRVKAAEIVLLPLEEIERLRDAKVAKHVPGEGKKTVVEYRRLIETEKDNFVPQNVNRRTLREDRQGREYYETETVKRPVAELIKKARSVG